MPKRKGWKGCCLMCAMNAGKVRGKDRNRHSASTMRELGRKRRFNQQVDAGCED